MCTHSPQTDLPKRDLQLIGHTPGWTARVGGITAVNHLTVTRTIRTRHYAIPGRLVNRSGHLILRLPTSWPWSDQFTRAPTLLRNLPLVA